MATSEQYANWIVANQDKKGTPEFETVATAYKESKAESTPTPETNPTSQISTPEDGSIATDLKNLWGGATSLTRGVLNTANEAYNDTQRNTNSAVAPAKQNLPAREMLGDKLLLPKGTDKESGAYGLGTLVDPASLAIGGGVSKVLPYAPVIGGSFSQGAKALTKNMLSGGITGGIIGGLSETGNAVDGAIAGAGANVAIPALMKTGGYVAKKGIQLLDPMLSNAGNQRAAARVMNEVSGNVGDRANIANLLTQARQGQTAADVVLPARNADVIGLQKLVGSSRSDLVDADILARDLTAKKGIDKIARTPEMLEAAIAKRKVVTEPMRQTAMQAADNFGQTPLDVNGLKQQISARMQQRGEGIGLDGEVMTKVSNMLDDIKKTKGQVYPEDLHEIRKKGINDILEKLNTGTPGSTQKRSAMVAKDIRDKIDSVLDNASGGQWTPYLKEFQKRSKLPNEIAVGQELKSALTGTYGNERSTVLGTKIKNLSENVNPETGKPFIDALGTGSKKSLDKVVKQFENERQMADLEKLGTPAALKVLRATESAVPSIPNRLSVETTAFNAVIKALQGRGGEKTNRELANLMFTNPKLLGELMKKGQTPNAGVKRVTDELMKRQAAMAANYSQQGER